MLSRETILEALARLSDELGKAGVLGELNLVGGTAMILAFNARNATKDVNAIFEPTVQVRLAARAVADSLSLPADWLNNAGDFVPLDSLDLSNLRIQSPTPEYMLAMKVMASRTGVANERGDGADIAFLIRLLNIKTAAHVMAIVTRYYDPARILPRSVYFVDEILEEIYPPCNPGPIPWPN